MEKKIIGIIRPLDMQQSLFVFDGSEQIDSMTTTIDEIKNDILILSDKYGIEQVDVTGPKTYTEHIVQECQEAELTKYSHNTIKFNLI